LETDGVAPPEKASVHEKVQIKADKIDFPSRRVVHLSGYAELERGGNRVYADELIYNNSRAESQAIAKGSVKFQTAQGDVIYTPILRYYMSLGKIVSGQANFINASRKTGLPQFTGRAIDSYGTASRITLLGRNLMLLENTTIVSCLDGNEHTVFTARELRVNLDEGIRTAKRVKIHIQPPDRSDRIQESVK
ncbi:MAG: hypothetical protein QNI91_16670, partial [Arenicellales bacterium]|nr:hypothetical protein [Arenicellales bacterium]